MNSGTAVVVRDKIAARLLEAGVITIAQIEQAKDQQKKDGGSLGLALMRLGAVDEKTYTEFLGKVYNLPVVDLDRTTIANENIGLIPADVATKFQVLPLERRGRVLTVAMANPSNIFAIDDIKFITSLDVQPVVCSEVAIKRAIDKYYAQTDSLASIMEGIEDDIEVVEEQEDDELGGDEQNAPVVKLVNTLLAEAVKIGASDIHIEPYEKHLRVRYRIDGVLQEVMEPPVKLKAAITSRLKIMSELDIAERRIPQDGRIKLKVGSKKVDLRVSTLPCIFGEKVVMRILDKGNLTLDLGDYGLEEKSLRDIYEAIAKPYGMVLVTGPTGSGKTTTLYSCLSRVNKIDVNIMTAEDPVEYNLDGINQVQVREEVGLTFAAALKAFLRQDPNIVMVGEIRDLETGSIAVKASLTGHLVFSTLHTNDAPATINRMIDMGLEPFLVASSTNLIMAQRLVRRICKNCKTVATVPPEALRDIGLPPKTVVHHGKGCEKCGGTGYSGRQGLYEVMPITGALRELILDRASTTEIRKQAQADGMLTLRQDGLIKIQKGITTIEEVLRETTVQE
ncbi:MAG TPA: type IV-A pilus assembly ATPase PilB [Candidatus Krumholzibacteria bacterium]|nr:type IV-A pilus assembly ATPase PilB [Candidatus Krumholzibacteria bacterium]HPD71455.1 type IV-A pilus assembly ATPase PilB [Candidatus Krumholzibacteria bacterium]HRY41612.1 type IV-A pilus assembly ATPase PilB [Candidatus Krumholzibacteria bacterium]